MVDMNAPLSAEIENELALIEANEVLEATIKWKDTEETEEVNIAMHGDMGADDDIFFYCESTNDFRALLKPDNGEDFVVTEFLGGKSKYPRN
jgi:hypothetical protein